MGRLFGRRLLGVVAVLALLVALVPVVRAQAAGQRLIMKDGSYQIITKYQVIGNRVRFFSAEREDWEEVPKGQVNWVATAKWKLDHGPEHNGPIKVTNPDDPGQVEAAKIDAEERAARQAELQRMPFVQPGLRLPNESGVWVLDTFYGQPELVHMTQANGDLNRAYQHSVLRYEAGSKRGSQQLVRIDGFAAKVELHVNQPVFYVSLDPPKPPKGAVEPASLSKPFTVDTHGTTSVPDDKRAHSSPNSRYVIIGLTVGKNERTATAGELDAIVAGGAPPATMVETEKQVLPGGYWMKVTPKTPLLIGQYALVEVLSPKQMNSDVWAFGVNPSANENADIVSAINSR
ncbi:MAG: hypothetical protein ACRD3F_06100 [Acidobacteriaceae bacterium]